MTYKNLLKLDRCKDPHIRVRRVRVLFDNPAYNYQTSQTGSMLEIASMFKGAKINVLNRPEEKFETPLWLEFLDFPESTLVELE